MSNIIWGEHSYGTPILRGNATTLTIGKYTSIAQNCRFDLGFQHRSDFISTFPFHKIYPTIESNIEEPQPITIGSDCWLGEDVMCFGGVQVGHGAIIGAKSLLTKNTVVGHYEIWGGIPAKFIKKRFDDYTISLLLTLKWWDLEENEIMSIAPLLASNKLDELFKLYNL